MRDAVWLTITLNDPLVVTENAATAGGHRCMTRIPGSTLLGVLAAQFYEHPPEGVGSWPLFHGGALSLSDAWPCYASGAPAFPAPFALRPPKSEKEEYWPCAGGAVVPSLQDSLRTAIDPKTGSAAEAQLFGYQALAAGQRFLCRVEADGLPKAAFDTLVAGLVGEKRLGRSRSAEYGRVTIARVAKAPELPQDAITGQQVVVWLLSDLALFDVFGAPRFVPTVEDFGLPKDATLRPEHSVVKTRRYTPFVAKWGRRDLERQVIAAGSTFVFDLPDGASVVQPLGCAGAYRNAGLGWFLVLAPDKLLTLGAKTDDTAPPAQAVTLTAPPLGAWMQARVDAAAGRKNAPEQINAFVDAMIRAYADARAYNGASPLEDFGPRKAQWTRIMSEARASRDRDELNRALDRAIPRDDKIWTQAIGPDGDFIDALKAAIGAADQGEVCFIIAEAAQRLAAKAPWTGAGR